MILRGSIINAHSRSSGNWVIDEISDDIERVPVHYLVQ